MSIPALATGALGFTLALSWNDALHRAVTAVVPETTPGAAAHAAFLRAVLVTLVVLALAAAVNYAAAAGAPRWAKTSAAGICRSSRSSASSSASPSP